MTFRHADGQAVYAPNSYGGPQADTQRAADLGWSVAAGEIGRHAYDKHAEDDDFGQAGASAARCWTRRARSTSWPTSRAICAAGCTNRCSAAPSTTGSGLTRTWETGWHRLWGSRTEP